MECCVHKSTRPTLLWRLLKHSQSDFDILITLQHPFIRLCCSSIPYKTYVDYWKQSYRSTVNTESSVVSNTQSKFEDNIKSS